MTTELHRRWDRWRSAVPKFFAIVLGCAALLSAVASVSAALGTRTQPIRAAIDVLFMPVPANLAYAVFVAGLAAGVKNRKRVAYRILQVFFALSALADLVLLADHYLINLLPVDVWQEEQRLSWLWPHLSAGNLALTAMALTVLALTKGEFSAKSQPAGLPRAMVTLTSLLGLSTLVGWGLVEAFPGSLRTSSDRFFWTVERVLGGAFVFDVNRHGRAHGWVNFVLGLLGAIALLAAVNTLLRSQRAAAAIDAGQEARIRALLAEHGRRDSLGYFATRRDKAVIFSPSGKAAVTYRVVVGATIASGDPIGDPEAWGQAIAAWIQLAREYAWTPAVMGASELGAHAYARAGLRALELGDEAILHVGQFDLADPQMRQVRQAVHRVQRAGYTVRIRRHCEIGRAEMARIIQLAARWRDTETERGFSMALGRLGDPTDGQCLLVEAFDPKGREAALLSFAPWGTDGVSLDLMRRDRSSDNGLIETMVCELMRDAGRLGITRVSLNFAVFRSVFEEGARIGAGPVLRLWRKTLLFFSKWFQLESLYRSNVKYRPEWVPRFLCFEDVRDLAQVSLASGIAEGFVVVPSLPTLLRRGAGPEEPGDTALAARSGEQGDPGVAAVGASAEQAASAQAGVAQAGSPEPGAAGGTGTDSAQMAVRLAKVDAMRAGGLDPYPPDFVRTERCAQITEQFAGLAADTATGSKVAVAGRIMLRRDHGGVCFATIRDFTGDLQIMLTADRLDAESRRQWRRLVDLGDHIGVVGEVVTSRNGTVSVLVHRWVITAKCLHPLPDKRKGVTDPEALVRQRHLDLIVNPESRRMLRTRSAAVHALRTTLIDRGYIEVETPILQRVHGGANARPFVTHINAYNMPLYLRIAPELFLKRLAAGGAEQVFELGRDFRNEGADATHNPEFTMLEAYQSYADYDSMREVAQSLIVAAATAANGEPIARRVRADGTVEIVDLGGEWPVVRFYDAVSAALGEKVDPDIPLDRLRRLAERATVPVNPAWGHGALMLEMYERLVEAVTLAPTFYADFPVEVSPLTREHRLDPRLAERWDLVAFGVEIGTAYTELVDPVEQRRRLTAQSLLAAGGDVEAMQLDEDFLRTLEYAMPPTGGLGLGVDRLIMLLTGRTIRETLPFPLVKG